MALCGSLELYGIMVRLKLLTKNVCGIGDNSKRRQVFNYLKRQNADVFMLQETHSSSSVEKVWTAEWGSEIIYSHGQPNSKGVCVMFKKNLNVKVLSIKKDTKGRLLGVKISIQDNEYAVLNLYAPNEDDPEFFRNMIEIVEELNCPERMDNGWDFNLVLDVARDKRGTDYNHNNALKVLEAYMNETMSIDPWRLLHQEE